MIMGDITKSMSFKGVLDCEILCLEMTESCLAANVFYRDGRYVCDVMAVFPYNEHEVEHLMTSNPRGKLILKQCKSFFFVLFIGVPSGFNAELCVLFRNPYNR